MARPILIEIALFLAPFVAYAIYLWATRTGVLAAESWPLGVLAGLTGAAVVLLGVGFVILVHFTGEPPRSSYTPAHLEDGKLVPGETKRPAK